MKLLTIYHVNVETESMMTPTISSHESLLSELQPTYMCPLLPHFVQEAQVCAYS